MEKPEFVTIMTELGYHPDDIESAWASRPSDYATISSESVREVAMIMKEAFDLRRKMFNPREKEN